jgi:hypothetical protein
LRGLVVGGLGEVAGSGASQPPTGRLGLLVLKKCGLLLAQFWQTLSVAFSGHFRRPGHTLLISLRFSLSLSCLQFFLLFRKSLSKGFSFKALAVQQFLFVHALLIQETLHWNPQFSKFPWNKSFKLFFFGNKRLQITVF